MAAKSSSRYRSMIAAAVCVLLVATQASSQKVTCRQRPMDIVFVIDGSRSVRPSNFEIVQDAVKKMIDTFENIGPDDTQIGLVQYSSRVRQEFPLNKFYTREEVKNAIDDMEYMQMGTMTGEALKYLVTETFTERGGARMDPKVAKVAVVITDGRSQDRTMPIWQKRVKDAGIRLFAIGIGRRISDKDLLLMASEPKKEHKFYVRNFETFRNLHLMVAEQICDDDPCSDAMCEFRCISVPPQGFRCECPPGKRLNRDEKTCKEDAKKAPVPQDLTITEVTHTSMKVKWQLDEPERAGEVMHYVVVHSRADGEGEQTSSETTVPEIVLEGLEPGTQYNVLVSAVTQFDFSPSAEGKDTTLFLGETEVTLTDPTLTTLTARWQPAGGDLLSGYTVETTKVKGPAEEMLDGDDPILVGPETHELKLQGLEPGTSYKAHVTPMHGKLKGKPGEDTETTKQLSPPQVEIPSTTLSTLTVDWTDIGVDADSYTVRVQRTLDPSDEKTIRVDGEDRSAVIRNLMQDTEYTVTVTGHVTEEGREFSSPPGQATGRTKDLTPPGVDIVSTTLTTADVMWVNTGVYPQYFTVSYCPTSAPEEKKSFDIEDISTKLTGLEPDTEYMVNVAGVVYDDDKKFSSSPGTDTDKTLPIGPPVVTIPASTTTTLDATWTHDIPGDNFEVTIQEVEINGKPIAAATVSGDVTAHTFPMLTPGTEYTVTVVNHVVDEGTPVQSPPGSATGATRPAPPQNLKVPVKFTRSLVATFEPSEGGSDWYEAKCVPSGGDPEYYDPIRVEKSDLTVTCKDLIPGVTYDIYVVTVFRGMKSDPALVMAGTVVGPPVNFSLSNPTTHTIAAKWLPPEDVIEVDRYILNYFSPQLGTVDEIQLPGTETSVILMKLHPSTLYEGSLKAIVGEAQSPKAFDSETTLPDDITLEVTDVSYSNISVAWPRSKVPHVVSYTLTYVPQRETEVSPDTSHLLMSVTIQPDKTTYVIMDVMPATIYDLTIQSEYPLGRSKVARATAVTLAPPPGPLSFTNTSDMGFVVHWGKPEYSAEPIGYTISYVPSSGETVVDVEVPSGEVLANELTGLETGKEYNISVVANYHYEIVSDPTIGKERLLHPASDIGLTACSCNALMQTQFQMQSTLEKLVDQINRLNKKIDRMEETRVPDVGFEVERRSRRKK